MLLLVVGLFGLVHLAAGNMPPSVFCPESFTLLIAENQNTVTASWNTADVSAVDQEDGTLTPELDKLSIKPGDKLEAGTYVVKYRVVDSGGRKDTCSIVITVEGANCPSLTSVQHGTSTCRQGATYGQTCSVICDQGYEVLGENAVSCQRDGTYDKRLPDCEEVTFYQRICENIATSPEDQFVSDIDANFEKLKRKLMASGALSSFRTMERVKELCSIKEHKNHGSCVFLRRYELFELFKTDPGKTQPMYRRLILVHPEVSKFCQNSIFLNQLYEQFPDIERFAVTAYQASFRNTMETLVKTSTSAFREEAKRICDPKKKGSECLVKDIFDLVDRSLLFISHLDRVGKWLDIDINNYFNALSFNAVLLKWKYNALVAAIRPQSNPVQQNIITEILRAIAMYVDDGADDKVRMVVAMFPEVITDTICNNGKMCLFWRVVDQTRIYVKSRQPSTANGTEVRILDNTLDLREFLQQKQMERILQLLADQEYNLVAVAKDLKNEFKKVINQRFSELKAYFKKIHSFNAAKAAADLDVINEINALKEASAKVAQEVDKDVTGILVSMIVTAGLEVHGKTTKLALTIAENCNPLKAISDLSLSGLYDASSELAHAIANLAKAGRLVAAINILKRQGTYIKNGFAKNEKFLLQMKTIMDSVLKKNESDDFEKAKDGFLEAYGNFKPAIKKAELTEMGSYFTNVVEQACDLIEGTETLSSAIPKGVIGGMGLCWTTKIKIDKMMTMYEEIYDKQFELVQALVDSVQAQVGLQAADGILSDYNAISKQPGESEDVLQKLQQVAGMSYVSYRLMVIQVIRLYCDELEYQNGGIRPHVCKDAGTQISTLLSYKVPSCQRKLEFETVPSHPRSHRDTAFMDIKKLYAGEEISFKIPNSRWLYRAGWITKADRYSVIYVSGFEVYLPTEVTYTRDIRVEVYVEGQNELVPGGKRYKLKPEKSMIFEYKLGHGVNCRQAHEFDNPYNTCPNNKIPDICQQTEYPCFLEVGQRALNPSIYSHFKIRVNGYEGLPVPDPATPLNIRIGMKTCTYIPERSRQQFHDNFKFQGRARKSPSCCPDGQFWSGRDQACSECPTNSTVALRGYYCERQKLV